MSIQALRERRNGAAAQARKLLDDGKENFTADLKAQVDALYADIEAIDAQIAREQKYLDLQAEAKFEPEAQGAALDGERALFDAWARKGEKGFTAAQMQQFMATMSTTTGSEGGFTVQSEVAKQVISTLKAHSAMRQVATVITTAQGNPLSYPTSDGTSEEGELIAENTQATPADPSFGTVALTPYKFGSKIIAVPFELLQDSSVDIEAFVRERMAERIGRITNKMFTQGTGSAQPTGIVTASSAGKVGATGSTLTISYDDLVDLMESVDDAYSNLAFMTSQTMRGTLRKLKDLEGRPLWVPSYDKGLTGEVADTLMGKPLIINNNIAVPAASAKSLVYGDFSKYIIRDVLQVSMFRFADSVYTSKGQVGFLAWHRSGGNLTDAKAVKHFQHSAT